MKFNRKHAIRMVPLAFCSFILLALLSACDLFGGAGSNASATPTTAAASTPAPASEMKLYTGDGFTIKYPQEWKLKEDKGLSLVSFTDPITQSTFTIQTTPNPGGLISSDQILAGAPEILKSTGMTKIQKDGAATSTTLAGETWKQQGFTSEITQSGQAIAVKSVVLTSNHPAQAQNTTAYSLAYAGAQALFDQTNSLIFQPMLQSFQYAG
jgi:hypothetical protein